MNSTAPPTLQRDLSRPEGSGRSERYDRSDRYERLDALRGLAIVWMVGFHFCFDLNYFHLLTPHQRFTTDPFWTTQRTLIVSLFLSCAGLGQALAWEAGLSWRRFARRWAQVAGCALLVSLGSAQMFPNSWISFGVLHGVAAMLLMVRLGLPGLEWLGQRLRWQRWLRGDGSARNLSASLGASLVEPLLLALAALALALPQLWLSPMFDSRWLNWTGLVSRLPYTEDYVPVLPWLGVMLLGLVAGRWLLRHRRHWFCGSLPRALAPLAFLGRWSLSIYMLHQPLLIGGLQAWVSFSQP